MRGLLERAGESGAAQARAVPQIQCSLGSTLESPGRDAESENPPRQAYFTQRRQFDDADVAGPKRIARAIARHGGQPDVFAFAFEPRNRNRFHALISTVSVESAKPGLRYRQPGFAAILAYLS